MGSSPSKNEVVHIRIPSSKGRSNSSSGDKETSKTKEISTISNYYAPSPNQNEVNQLRKELDVLRDELKTQKQQCLQAEETSFSFQTQLDEREREILLLREEISSLQSSPPSTADKVSEEEIFEETGENFDRTVHAKDQYIKTLEDELNNIKRQTNLQNERYQKKVKKIKGMLSKSRQDSSLKLFELKDENSKLTEKNTKLQERLERLSMDSGEFSRQSSATSTRSFQKSQDKNHTDVDHHDDMYHHDDPRMKLILELSEQVANLDAENSKLKQELRHCKKIAEKVEKVRIQKKKNSGRAADIVVVEKSASTWKAVDGSGYSHLEIGEQA